MGSGAAVSPRETRLLRIEGRVQGVGYRVWCAECAEALGLAGWVRNRLDGSVEVLLQGPAEALAGMEAALRQGPRGARVDSVTPTTPAPEPVALDGFELRTTA